MLDFGLLCQGLFSVLNNLVLFFFFSFFFTFAFPLFYVLYYIVQYLINKTQRTQTHLTLMCDTNLGELAETVRRCRGRQIGPTGFGINASQ